MKLIPYIFSHSETWQSLELAPDILKYDCVHLSSNPFFELLEKLDQASFGGQGMGMERWTFYDCGAMPGVIYGYAVKRSDIKDNDYETTYGFNTNQHEYIPITMFIIIPKVGAGNWFAHNLCSLGGKLGVNGLGIKTKVDALNALKVKNLYGATQWGSPAVHIHSQIADLELVSAYTPNHSYPYTLTYRCHGENWSIGNKKKISVGHDRLIEVQDQKAITKLHYEIENGLQVKICGRPIMEDSKCYYPLSIYK